MGSPFWLIWLVWDLTPQHTPKEVVIIAIYETDRHVLKYGMLFFRCILCVSKIQRKTGRNLSGEICHDMSSHHHSSRSKVRKKVK